MEREGRKSPWSESKQTSVKHTGQGQRCQLVCGCLQQREVYKYFSTCGFKVLLRKLQCLWKYYYTGIGTSENALSTRLEFLVRFSHKTFCWPDHSNRACLETPHGKTHLDQECAPAILRNTFVCSNQSKKKKQFEKASDKQGMPGPTSLSLGSNGERVWPCAGPLLPFVPHTITWYP